MSLVEDLLDLTRLQFGRFELNMDWFCIKDLTKLLENLFRFQIERKGLQFIIDVSEEAKRHMIFSDQRRIHQVLLNLAANAMKFTFKGFIKITIAIVEGAVRFEVQDSGVGIKRESLPNLFKLFGKLQENEDLNKTGCGIGLHVSQEIVTRMGGLINV